MNVAQESRRPQQELIGNKEADDLATTKGTHIPPHFIYNSKSFSSFYQSLIRDYFQFLYSEIH